MIWNAEEQATTPAAATVQPPKAAKRPHVAPRKRRVAPGKPKSGKKAIPASKRPKSQTAAKQAKPAAGAREGSKAAKVLSLLRRPDGASLQELMKATGWLAHSVRGFLSGAVAKRMGLKLVSAKSESGERRYSVQA
jgi:hypothetical protein